MVVRIEKPEFNLRDKLSQLDRRVGSTGGEILASKSPEDVQRLIGVGSKNMIINGGMQIAQRGTSSTLNGSSGLQFPCCDRWGGQFSAPNSTFTVSQSTDAPVGHSHSLKFLTNSAVTVDGNHYYWIGQRIEGLFFAQSGWNASASGRSKTPQPCTLSFWVKSSLTGKWCASLKGMNNHTYSYLIVYEIKKPDTWEWKTHTIYPSPELTNWNYDNAAAIAVQFDVGTSRIGDLATNVIGEWQNNNAYTYNNDKFIPSRIHGIAGATWYLTGVQFEPGPVATPFEHRGYAEELALCERYYEVHWQNHNPNNPAGAHNDGYNAVAAGGVSGTKVYFPFKYRTQKRASPTISYDGKFRTSGGGSGNDKTPDEFYSPSIDGCRLRFPQSGGSNGDGAWLEFDGANSTSGYIAISAEL